PDTSRWKSPRRSTRERFLPAWSTIIAYRALSREPKEPVKYSPIHRQRGEGVSEDENTNAAADSGSADGIREIRAEVQTGTVSGGDGAGGAVGRVEGADRTALSEGVERAAAGGTGDYAAGVLSTAVVQPE